MKNSNCKMTVKDNEIIIDFKDFDPKICRFRLAGLQKDYNYIFCRGEDDSEIVMLKSKIPEPEDFGGRAVDISFLAKDRKAIG